MTFSTLEQLKKYTVIVADTGDLNSIKQFKPHDATTNPTLIFKSVQNPEYKPLIEQIIRQYINNPIEKIIDAILVTLGVEILKLIPGRVSIEIDARFSFDTKKTIEKARDIISAYRQAGIDKSRILIKIASTWEGIQAARQLQLEGIACNMTLLFCQAQAIACAQAKVQLISPFVGRILDWYKQTTNNSYTATTDPGVLSVQNIYAYYKHQGIKTEIMGASFRNIEQIIALTGCDLLTISPDLLSKLHTTHIQITSNNAPLLDNAFSKNASKHHFPYSESDFRWELNENAMATEKLAEGIRLFTKDTIQLEHWLLSLIPTLKM